MQSKDWLESSWSKLQELAFARMLCSDVLVVLQPELGVLEAAIAQRQVARLEAAPSQGDTKLPHLAALFLGITLPLTCPRAAAGAGHAGGSHCAAARFKSG